jgi:hypothetical protein
VTGVSATGIANYAVWDAIVYLDGWGRAGWGEFAFGEGSISVQGTTALGTAALSLGASVSVTGVEATTTLGNVVANGDGAIDVLGNAATGQIGTASVEADAIVAVTGVEGTGQLGVAGPVTTVDVAVTGVQGTTALGSPTVTGIAHWTRLDNRNRNGKSLPDWGAGCWRSRKRIDMGRNNPQSRHQLVRDNAYHRYNLDGDSGMRTVNEAKSIDGGIEIAGLTLMSLS